jgi:hypothetical protein
MNQNFLILLENLLLKESIVVSEISKILVSDE